MEIHKASNKNSRAIKRILVFIIGFVLLLLGILFSLSVGAATIDFKTVVYSFFESKTKEAMIIQSLRLPRAIVGAIVGANLAIAGAIMQAITKNPLASPQVFGVNAGASLMVVIAVVLLSAFSPSSLIVFAFLGATLGGAIVYYMASTGGGMTPIKLALAGITVHMFLSAIIEGIIIFHEHSTEDILFWLAGAVDGRDWGHVRMVLPWSVIGIFGALLLSKQLTILSFGDDMARGLGQKITYIRLLASILVIFLAGSSVAVAGPIGFIGLIIPHIVRKLVGFDYRVVIPCSALLGAVLLVFADVLSRFISFPSESPVGIVTALIGGPFFLYLARKGGR